MVSKATDYKVSALGRIPSHWNIRPLNELFEEVNQRKGDNDYPILSCTKDGIVPQSEHFNKRVASEDDSQYKVAKYGDLVVSGLNLHLGGIDVQTLVPAGAVSPAYYVFRKVSGEVDLKFIQYLLRSEKYIQFYDTQVTQIGASIVRRSTPRSKVKSLPVILPPLPEQRKIADILTSVDDAIAATQRIIDQTERVKRGLMQQLLTRGIGHTKFKKTEIGEIPAEWDVAQIGKMCQTTSGGTPKRSVKAYYENGTIPWIKTGELGIKYIYNSEERITDEAVRNSSAKILPQNTVLVAMYGATIGKSSILKIEAATNQACCAILCDEKKVHHEFLYYILSFRKDELVNLGAGGAQPNISQQLIKRFSIPIPPIEEQRQIAVILARIDDKLQHEHKTLQTYSSLKVSLMNVLLTGKVRVKVDEQAEAVV